MSCGRLGKNAPPPPRVSFPLFLCFVLHEISAILVTSTPIFVYPPTHSFLPPYFYVFKREEKSGKGKGKGKNRGGGGGGERAGHGERGRERPERQERREGLRERDYMEGGRGGGARKARGEGKERRVF